MFVAMHEGVVEGCFVMGQNPAVGGQNAGLQRAGLAKLEWLVVRDIFVTETATFWKARRKSSGELARRTIETEVFFLPAATVAEMDGSFTNTQRLVQWHDKAVEPPGDCRATPGSCYHSGERLKARYADSPDPDATGRSWHRPGTTRARRGAEPDPEARAQGDQRLTGPRPGGRSRGFADLKADGTTACGCWIYTGVYADGVNQARPRRTKDDGYISPGWAFAWPANPRILYNRAAADPAGPTLVGAEEIRLVGRGAGPVGRLRQADFPRNKRPDDRGVAGRERAGCHSPATPRSS